MKQRQTTYQIDRKVSQVSHLKQNSSQNRHNGLIPTGPGSFKLTFADRPKFPATDTPKAANTSAAAKSAHAEQLADELSNSELTGFAHACVEALCSVSSTDTNTDIQNKLQQLASQQLTSLTALIAERKEAKTELKQLVAWSKNFVAEAKPQLQGKASLATEANQLNLEVLQSVERCMGAKFRVKNIEQRINQLKLTIPAHVQATGEELGLPAPIMQKIAETVQKALSNML